jgi:hypothetical protein
MIKALKKTEVGKLKSWLQQPLSVKAMEVFQAK